MIITEKTSGKKIGYVVDGNKITFNDEIMFNLAKYERDYPLNIDVCIDSLGCLIAGVVDGVTIRYVAQIVIPAKTYHTELVADEISGEENEVQIADQFDIDKCELILWGLER